ncbi:MAG: coenzyme F420-0:L-glutamate ligase [Patescibacteria group bacterium]
MNITPIKTRLFEENESIVDFILEHITELPENSVLAVTSKIVALNEGRTAEIENENTKEKLIRAESDIAIRTDYTWLTIMNNSVLSSAGIDASNANGKYILLPKNSFVSAKNIREQLLKHYAITNFGVVITDSRTMAFKAGALGVALGYAGFEGLRSYKGKPDLYGRELNVSRVNIADSLATSAMLTMGEADESQPLAIITKAPVTFTDTIDQNELAIDIKNDLYKPLFDHLNNK